MARFPAPIEDLMAEFARFPGIGEKSAERFVLYLLGRPKKSLGELAATIEQLRDRVTTCSICGTYTEMTPCSICRDPGRDKGLVCVVATAADLLAIEQTHEFPGQYHVLGGVLKPVDGVAPEQLRLRPLFERIEKGTVREVLIATNPDMEGEATAFYLYRELKKFNVKVTRLARGLPMGSDLEYADEITLGNAIQNRRSMENGRSDSPPTA